jgi:hypothetical protein
MPGGYPDQLTFGYPNTFSNIGTSKTTVSSTLLPLERSQDRCPVPILPVFVPHGIR